LRSPMETLPGATTTAMEPCLCCALSDECSCRRDHTFASTYTLGTMADQTATVFYPYFRPTFARHRLGTSRSVLSSSGELSVSNIIVRASLPAWHAGQILGHTSSSLTHQHEVFAVRHRLRSNSLARAFAPFVVELFAVGCLNPTPDPVKGPIPPVTRPEAPHASRGCSSTDLRPTARSPWTGFAPALCQAGFSSTLPKHFHVAHLHKHVLTYRIERRDYSGDCFSRTK